MLLPFFKNLQERGRFVPMLAFGDLRCFSPSEDGGAISTRKKVLLSRAWPSSSPFFTSLRFFCELSDGSSLPYLIFAKLPFASSCRLSPLLDTLFTRHCRPPLPSLLAFYGLYADSSFRATSRPIDFFATLLLSCFFFPFPERGIPLRQLPLTRTVFRFSFPPFQTKDTTFFCPLIFMPHLLNTSSPPSPLSSSIFQIYEHPFDPAFLLPCPGGYDSPRYFYSPFSLSGSILRSPFPLVFFKETFSPPTMRLSFPIFGFSLVSLSFT